MRTISAGPAASGVTRATRPLLDLWATATSGKAVMARNGATAADSRLIREQTKANYNKLAF